MLEIGVGVAGRWVVGEEARATVGEFAGNGVWVREGRLEGASELHWGTVKLAREWGRSG